MRHQADDLWVFSRQRDVLEVVQPDLIIWQFNRSHGQPTS